MVLINDGHLDILLSKENNMDEYINFNEWWLSLSEGQQNAWMEDKWLLADISFRKGQEIERKKHVFDPEITMFAISLQGVPKVHSCYIKERSEKIALINIDLDNRHCEIEAKGGGSNPNIMVGASNSKGGPTCIEFINFKGNWNVFSASITKYTLAVTLIKEEE